MKQKYIPITLLVVAAVLRLAWLDQAQFWYDEAFTAWLSRLPFSDMLQATAGDTHPPLYLVLMWIISHLIGGSELVLRLPSAVFSVASVWLTWRLANHFKLSEPARIATAGFMVVSSLQLHFAQEARMYALLQMDVLFMLLAMFERRWWLLGMASLATLLTHNYGLFYLPVVGLIGLHEEMKRPVNVSTCNPFGQTQWQERDRSNPVALIVSLAIPVMIWLPWGWALKGQMDTVSTGYWIQPVSPGSVIYSLYMLFWGFAMPEKLQPLAVMVTAGALSFGIWNAVRTKRLQLLWFGFTPLMMAVVMSLIWKPVLLFRGLIGSAPILYMLVAEALAGDRLTRWQRSYALVLVIPVVVGGLVGHYLYNPGNKGDIKTIINQVRAEWLPGDLIYHINDGTAVGWGLYANDLAQYELVECPEHNLGALSQSTRDAMGIQSGRVLPGEHRTWLIWSAGPTSTQCEVERGTALIERATPFTIIRDDEYILSGVWYVESK